MSLTKRLVRHLIPLLALVVAVPVLGASTVHAADNGAWSVAPAPADASSPTPRSYFVLEGTPGSTLTDKVRIKNFTNGPLTFSIYGADGYNTAEGGFFALRGLDLAQQEIGAWVTVPVQKVKVAKRTQVDVPITIQIPENATPGDHVGGIVALNGAVEGTTKSGGVDLGIKRAVAARMYLRVSGPVTPALKISDVRIEHDRGLLPWSGDGEATISYTVKNTGNLRLSPESVVTLTGVGGRELDKVENAPVIDLLPGQTANLKVTAEGIGVFDRATAEVTVRTADGVADTAEAKAWIVPWLLIALVLALIAGGVFWWWRRRAERNKAFESLASAPKLTISAGR